VPAAAAAPKVAKNCRLFITVASAFIQYPPFSPLGGFAIKIDFEKISNDSSILPIWPNPVKKTTNKRFLQGPQLSDFFIFWAIDYCLSKVGIWIILLLQDV
jgi:hypothetical protein